MNLDGGGTALLVVLVFAVVAVALVLTARYRARQHAALGERAVARPDALPLAPPTSPAGILVSRAESAVNRIRDLSRAPGDPWLRDHVAQIDGESTAALTSLRALAGRVTVVEQTIARADPTRLDTESRRLRAEALVAATEAMREAHEASAAAVDEQLATANRLAGLRAELLARMEPVSIGLEGVAARMGEVIALGSAAIEPEASRDAVAGLNAQLESLRTGLSVAESLADRGLSDPAGPALPPSA